jgi:hypothetical protein
MFKFSWLLIWYAVGLTAQPITIEESVPVNLQPLYSEMAKDIYALEVGMFHHRAELPIHIYYRGVDDNPITSLNDWANPTAIMIGINVRGWYPPQFALQFSHEIGHVMQGPRRNNGFIDTLCVALSLEVVTSLLKEWTARPPALFKTGDLIGYRERTETEHMDQLNPVLFSAYKSKNWKAVANYISTHTSEIDPASNYPHYREAQIATASAVLSGPVDWTQLIGTDRCTEPPPAIFPMFTELLPISTSCLDKFRDISCRMGYHCPPVGH